MELENISDEELLQMMPPKEDVVEEEQQPAEEVHEEQVTEQPVQEEVTEDLPDEALMNMAKQIAGQSEEVPSEVNNNINYKEFYEQVMAPFKANDKMVELRNADEAIKLMQMGANYTRKMQQLSKYRKIIKMMEKGGILDEEQLDFLISLKNKDPSAIQKYFKDNQLDPFDIDTDSSPSYQAGSHRISDKEYRFTTILDEIKESQDGMKSIQTFNSWDSASKDMLWEDPSIMRSLDEQIRSGVYDYIVQEMNRDIALGNLEPDLPFLQAYKATGDKLVSMQQANLPREQEAPKPVYSGSAGSSSARNYRAKAAASTSRGNSYVAQEYENPFAMPDDKIEEMDAFLRQMSNRV